jgi:hypothetical protein
LFVCLLVCWRIKASLLLVWLAARASPPHYSRPSNLSRPLEL